MIYHDGFTAVNLVKLVPAEPPAATDKIAPDITTIVEPYQCAVGQCQGWYGTIIKSCVKQKGTIMNFGALKIKCRPNGNSVSPAINRSVSNPQSIVMDEG